MSEAAKPPKREQIADDLRAKIRSGELPPGAAIPGENAISTQIGRAHV